MGYGDQLIATGLARGAADRGRRIAFGDGVRIIWDGRSREIFAGNPNIAPPGSERARDIEWIKYYKGKRGYNKLAADRWIWNLDWRCKPGEMYFTETEKAEGARHGSGFILIESKIERWKSIWQNKDWGAAKYQTLALALRQAGFQVVQFSFDNCGPLLFDVLAISTPTFRQALAVLANAALYIGPEGGLHHGAAALGVPAVVIFGGWVPPDATGYPGHYNISRLPPACGLLKPCNHCIAALAEISVDEVYSKARSCLAGSRAIA